MLICANAMKNRKRRGKHKAEDSGWDLTEKEQLRPKNKVERDVLRPCLCYQK